MTFGNLLSYQKTGNLSVACKWVYKVKVDGDGRVELFKSRMVAQGYKQTKGADYDETFSKRHWIAEF